MPPCPAFLVWTDYLAWPFVIIPVALILTLAAKTNNRTIKIGLILYFEKYSFSLVYLIWLTHPFYVAFKRKDKEEVTLGAKHGSEKVKSL